MVDEHWSLILEKIKGDDVYLQREASTEKVVQFVFDYLSSTTPKQSWRLDTGPKLLVGLKGMLYKQISPFNLQRNTIARIGTPTQPYLTR